MWLIAAKVSGRYPDIYSRWRLSIPSLISSFREAAGLSCRCPVASCMTTPAAHNSVSTAGHRGEGKSAHYAHEVWEKLRVEAMSLFAHLRTLGTSPDRPDSHSLPLSEECIRTIGVEQVSLLYSHAPTGFFATLVNAGIVVAVLAQKIHWSQQSRLEAYSNRLWLKRVSGIPILIPHGDRADRHSFLSSARP